MTNNFLTFWLGYYIHIEAISFTILSQSRLPIKILAIRTEKVVIFQKMIKEGLKKYN